MRDTMHVPMFDKAGRIVGHAELPSDVLRAAGRLYSWMMSQHRPYDVKLNGLRLYRDDER